MGSRRSPRTGLERTPPRRRRARGSRWLRRLPQARGRTKPVPRKPRKPSRTRRNPRINRGTGIASAGSGLSNGLESLVLERGGESVEHLVHLAPALQRFHPIQPAFHVGIRRVVATDDLAEGDERAAEIIRDGDLIAAQEFLLRSQQAFI